MRLSPRHSMGRIMPDSKQGFLSYSHQDRDFAEQIARELRDKGVDVWLDKWEIQPGDSLIQKIFSEGLHGCDVFLVLLSPASVASNWVRQELDAAMIRKIEGITRIIPVIKEKCELPAPLRALLWVDLSQNFNEGIRQIVHAIFDVPVRPPLGPVPSFVTGLSESHGGLSREATTVGEVLLQGGDEQRGDEARFSGENIKTLVPFLSEDQIDNAVDELASYGLVKVQKWMGTAPYGFGEVHATYACFLHFQGNARIGYDPQEDIKTVASAVAAKGQATGKEIQDVCGLSPLRINRAVAYLRDYGIVQVMRYLGTAPFDFGQVSSDWKTKQFVAKECN